MKKSYVFLADGFEEIEALSTIDILRRSGVDVTSLSINPTTEVTGANGIKVIADGLLADADLANADWLIAPGGMPGASNLAADKRVTNALTEHYRKGGRIAAICAAPAVVLAPLGILDRREATCYPGFEEACSRAGLNDVRVVALDTLITANGPSSAIPFALAIAKATIGEEKAREVAQGLLCHYPMKWV